ncbi:MAG TPA: nucleotide exchange factor GrpE [Gemmataceae bacterium]|nr:nucleotide exchange factor GrpE [Gemmataceae bacterium]
MSEWPSPAVAGDAAVHPQTVLTPEAIEGVLSDFRSWLHQLAGAAPPDGVPQAPAEHAEAIDLHTLLGQFIALRHEVNLQTRAVRAQQEQGAEALRQLSQALAAVGRDHEAAETSRRQELVEQQRPLLKALVDVYDALSLAAREAQRVADLIRTSLDQVMSGAQPKLTGLAAWLAREQLRRHAAADAQRRQGLTQAADRVRQFLESLVTGYTMSLRRVERTLEQQHLEPIPCVGAPFDPEAMEVVDAVSDSGLPAGQVVEEVRPGYRWQGRLFRYAQVRVAK